MKVTNWITLAAVVVALRIKLWYNGGMEVTDWITLGAVVVALGIGVTSIVQNKRIRKKQYENSVLDNILRWTLDIPKCVAERSISPIIAGAAAFEKAKETKVTQLVDLTNRVNWFHRFEVLETESESIKATALIFKNSNLNKTIETAVNNLKAHIAVLKRK